MITKTINIKRLYFKEFYTIGKCTVDGEYICDTIEDKVRVLNSKEDKVYGETAIPAGTYNADIYFSKKFGYKVVRLFDVPYFEGIYVHKGNTAKDSLGCIILGYNDKKGWVSRPTIALNKLIKAVEGADKIIVTIE
jgi:inhibitor of KinA sporulation pathway (predicted exonuclease)